MDYDQTEVIRLTIEFIPLKSILLKKTSHMLNRKGGRPGQEICHKKDGNGRFDCPKKILNIFAVTAKLQPSLLIKSSGECSLTATQYATLWYSYSNLRSNHATHNRKNIFTRSVIREPAERKRLNTTR